MFIKYYAQNVRNHMHGFKFARFLYLKIRHIICSQNNLISIMRKYISWELYSGDV